MAEQWSLWVAAVKAHALEHYNADGWDYIVEAFSDSDILEIITGPSALDGKAATTEVEAIEKVREVAKLLDDRRRDIQATAW